MVSTLKMRLAFKDYAAVKNLKDDEKKIYSRKRIYNQPENFEELSLIERFNW